MQMPKTWLEFWLGLVGYISSLLGARSTYDATRMTIALVVFVAFVVASVFGVLDDMFGALIVFLLFKAIDLVRNATDDEIPY